MNMKKQHFSLVELLTVIAVIAILAGILIPTVGAVKESGRATQALTEAKGIHLAITSFYNDHKYLPSKDAANGTTNDIVYSNCTVVTTLTITSTETEITYNNCLPVGCRMANDDESGASVAYVELYSKRGILYLGGYTAGTEAKVELIGYPIKTESIQERNVTSNSLVLDTKIMNYDVSTYSTIGTVLEKEQIKRKYLEWYKKKFKYKFQTRGEPLVNAGDYGVIQTQFTEQMPVYILQNSWTFDGTWSGDMEVIALD